MLANTSLKMLISNELSERKEVTEVTEPEEQVPASCSDLNHQRERDDTREDRGMNEFINIYGVGQKNRFSAPEHPPNPQDLIRVFVDRIW